MVDETSEQKQLKNRVAVVIKPAARSLWGAGCLWSGQKNRLRRNSSLRRRLYLKQESKVGASSRHWRSVARDYWQSLHKRDQLRLPLSTAASCLPALREAFTYRLPNHVDNWSFSYVASTVRDGCHSG